ncbi:MAG: Hsp33 family molecular chaperone HslO, partial [Clostridia bacterium]|nr:Hsp33 family molecular chaperone HslO [Clostridia bacterium]
MADRLIKALAAEGMLRVTLIDGTLAVREARRMQGLSRVASAALGRQLLMTLILCADLKNETDRVTTIVRGGGPAGSMICTGRPDCLVKGMLQHPEVELPLSADGKLDVGAFVGREGTLTVIRDLSLKEPYTGSCKLVSGEIAEDFAQYFYTSQQQPSLVYLGVRVQADSGEILSAGGLLCQPLPGCPEETLDEAARLGGRIAGLSAALEARMEPERFLMEAFQSLGPVVLERREPRCVCDCSRERI